MSRPRRTLFERWSEKVLIDDGCWEWTGTKRGNGYGMIGVVGDRTRSYGAHCAAYELFVGRIPPGMEILHSCDNRGCVKPSHLSAGTHRENMLDMARKGRSNTEILTPDQVRAVRFLLSGGLPQHEVAEMLGVSQPCVSSINRGRTWTWLTD